MKLSSLDNVAMRSALVLIACLCKTPLVLASETDNVFRLGEVQVSAPSIQSSGTGTSAVTDDEIELLNRDTVGEALDTLPGVSASLVGTRNEQMVYIRGFDLKQVPVLLDGIPIYVPYDGYVDLGRLTSFDLSEVQVSKGFTSVLYGPNAMGGAINLVSRRPRKSLDGNFTSGLTLDRNGGRNGYRLIANAGILREKWYVQLGASELNKDHFGLSENFAPTKAQSAGARQNSYNKDRKFSIKAAYSPTKDDEYSLSYINQHAEKGTPPYAGTDPSISVRYWQWPYWDKQSVYWISKSTLTANTYLKTRAFYDQFKNALNSYDDSTYATQTKPYAFKSLYDDFTYGGSTEVGSQLSTRDILKAAFHYKRDNHSDHNEGEPIRKFADDTYSIGLENTYTFESGVDAIVGASYDWRKSISADNYNSTTQTITPFTPTDNSAFNPQIGLVYRLSPSGDLHASISKRSRFPTIKDRYSYRFGSALPNPDLKPERALNYEIGATEQFFDNTRIDLSLFVTDITDAIQSVNVSSNVTQNQNVGKVVAKGVELGVRTFAISQVELGTSYTFLHRQNVSNPNLYPTDTPKHKWFTFAKYTPIEKLSLVSSIELCSGRVVRSDGLSTGEFSLANFKASYEILANLSAEAGVNNLTDRNFEIASGFPEEGRNYFFNARYAF